MRILSRFSLTAQDQLLRNEDVWVLILNAHLLPKTGRSL
jgi:hypothetical protein